MDDTNTLSHVLRQFGLKGELRRLPGGTQAAFRVGNVVLKRVHETSLENDRSPELSAWIAQFCSTLPVKGFRIPRPLATVEGAWCTPEGWTAWTFMAGQHATPADVPACIAAITAFHRALRPLPQHPLLETNSTPWGKADRWCWGERPAVVQPQLRPYVDHLYALRRPLPGLQHQLIHGDLNPENILIAPGVPPALLDLSPFWGPPTFALAIFANFIGPRRGDSAVLRHFEDIEHFDQLLIRAGIRMLLVMAVIDHLEEWATCSEKRAAEMIIAYVER